jgi:predicted nucleotidyltransferase
MYLFGSRVDPEKKGGDIDLLMVVTEADLKTMLLDKHHLLLAIKSKIGEQKIDLIITTEEKIAKDEFLKSLIPSCILL